MQDRTVRLSMVLDAIGRTSTWKAPATRIARDYVYLLI